MTTLERKLEETGTPYTITYNDHKRKYVTICTNRGENVYASWTLTDGDGVERYFVVYKKPNKNCKSKWRVEVDEYMPLDEVYTLMYSIYWKYRKWRSGQDENGEL